MNPPMTVKLIKQLPGFGITGLIVVLANMAVTAVFKDVFGLAIEIAYLAGYASALIIGFVICRHLLFKATAQNILKQLTFFVLSSLVFRGFEYAASLGLHKTLEIHYLAALGLVAMASFLVKLVYYRSVVFRTT